MRQTEAHSVGDARMRVWNIVEFLKGSE